MPPPELLVTLSRAGQPESEHYGSIAVVDENGRLIAHAGDPLKPTFLRSCAKPFQALPVISSGVHHRFGFTDPELAVMAGSHSGQAVHIEAVRSILSKIGLSETALLCGAHAPHTSSVLHNNCSGKHAGMLAVAMDMGLSASDYLEQDHPVQKIIREGMAHFLNIKAEDLVMGTDGCSAPTFLLPLVSIAHLFARLAAPLSPSLGSEPSVPTMKSVVGSGRTWSRADALAMVAELMMKYPVMVAGDGRLDTEVMRVCPGAIVMKGGAEGVQGIGVVKAPGHTGPLGIAFKISDGNGRRAAGPVAIEILRQLRVIEEGQLKVLSRFWRFPEKNHRGLEVGQVKAEFHLKT